MSAEPTRRTVRLALAALLVVTALCYARTLGHGFVEYDDPQYVLTNPAVRAGLTGRGLAWALTSFDNLNWHPVTWLSHMLDVQWFGLWAGGHHLTSVLFHLGNTLLVYLVLRALTAPFAPALLGAALFGVHPQHVESVAWIAERKDVLSAFFGLASLLAWLGYVRAPSLPRWLATLGLLALGLAAKPMLVTWPAVFLLLDVWPLRRWSERGAWRCIVEKLPFFALAAITAILTVQAQSAGAIKDLQQVPLPGRVANALVAYALYLWKTVWPVDLAVFYPRPAQWPLLAVAAAGAVLLAITAAALAFARRRPFLPIGWAWFVGMLVPVIGLVQVGDQALADRYAYLPHVGLFVAIVFALPLQRNAVATTASLCVAALAFCTVWQVGHWKDSRTLFERARVVGGPSPTVEHNLGVLCLQERDFAGAVPHLVAAIGLEPTFVRARANLVTALLELRKPDEALKVAQEARALRPEDGLPHALLGRIFAATGDAAKALPEYQAAVRALPPSPDAAEAQTGLANVLAALGRLDEAKAAYEAALGFGLDSADLHNNLGAVFARLGKPAEAVQHFQQALRLAPDDPQLHFNLARLHEDQRHFELAIASYENVLRRDGNHVQAMLGLAWLRATAAEAPLRDGKLALQIATRAVALVGRKQARTLDVLAAAEAESGAFARAEATAKEALQLAQGARESELAKKLEERAALYRSGKAFRR